MSRKSRYANKVLLLLLFVFVSLAGIVVVGPRFAVDKNSPDSLFGWKYPVAKFPSVGPLSGAIAYSDIRDPGGIPQGLPIRLKIPTIGVNTAIEDALITPDGRMDVSAGSVNVAWFSLGPHPGKVGSAVIGGHFGITNGVPFVFYNLDKLKIDDKVYIENDNGDTLAFQVREIRSYDRDADATDVFTSSDGLAHLNLITCEGVWNRVNDTYPDRLVVFTDAIASEGPIAVVPGLPAAAVTESESDSTQTVAKEPSQIQVRTLPIILFATPLDILITSFLLISIIFVAAKIIRHEY